MAKLQRDRDVWLDGGWPEVQIVILINWKKVIAGVKGTVEVYARFFVTATGGKIYSHFYFLLNLKLKIVIENT